MQKDRAAAHLVNVGVKQFTIPVSVQKVLPLPRMCDSALYNHDLIHNTIQLLQAQLRHQLAIVWEGVDDVDLVVLP